MCIGYSIMSLVRCLKPMPRVFYTLTSINNYHTGIQTVCMAGHNRWSKIKRPKAIADLERSKELSKISKEIQTAIKVESDGNPETNKRLASIILRARSANISKTAIEKSIEAGIKQFKSLDTHIYEAKGPSGYVMIIETETSDKDRTKGELRKILSRHGSVNKLVVCWSLYIVSIVLQIKCL